MGPVDSVILSARGPDDRGMSGKSRGVCVMGGEVGGGAGVKCLDLNNPNGVRTVQAKEHEVRSVVEAGAICLHEASHGTVAGAKVGNDPVSAQGG